MTWFLGDVGTLFCAYLVFFWGGGCVTLMMGMEGTGICRVYLNSLILIFSARCCFLESTFTFV